LKIRLTWSGRPGVEVVADDVFEEHPPGDRPVQDLGQGELGLQHGDVVEVAGLAVGGGERVRQACQPLAQQPVDLGRAEPVADRLDCGRVVAGGEPVVQRGMGDPGLGTSKLNKIEHRPFSHISMN